MSPSNRTIKVGGVWAQGAVDPPATPVQSTTYADSGVTEGEIQAGWPFADIVESAKFNEVLRRITSLIKLAEEWGVLPWNSSTTYATKALVMGSNGEIYYCKVASSTGNDPTTSPTQWGLAFEASGSVSAHADLAAPHSGQTPKTSSGSTTNTADATGHTHTISAASETVKGAVELATAAETTAGTDNTRAVHPAGLKVELDKKAPVASPALTGEPTAPTAAADTSTTQLATTAFVIGQAGGVVPTMDGTGAAGTSKSYSRQDHRHPTDTTRAPVASPTLTGVPTAPTAANGTNTTQLATTAFACGAVSKSAAGYQKLPSGLIIQWATSALIGDIGSDVLININFPLAFPTAVLHVFPAVFVTASTGVGYTGIGSFWVKGATTLSTARIYLREYVAWAQNYNYVNILAIGY